MQDSLLLQLTEKIKECEEIAHTAGIPFISVLALDTSDRVYCTVLTKKDKCRPAFWLLGAMSHITRGKIDDDLFEDCGYQYHEYQTRSILYTDELQSAPEYLDAVLNLKTACEEFKQFVEEKEWELPWFIVFESLDSNALTEDTMFSRNYYSTNILFDAVPAFTVAMYIARCHRVEEAARLFIAEQVGKENSSEYHLLQEYC